MLAQYSTNYLTQGLGGMASGGPSKSILIVDDDAEFRAFVSAVLGQAGYRVIEAATGEDALATVRFERPHLLVLDVRLPGLSGYEVCHQLRREFGESLPILFVSGERMESFDRVAGLLLGGDDYLVKPFAPDELLARVRCLVRRAPPAVATAASSLTGREAEILRLLAAGLDQDEIADRLLISPKTVAVHIGHINSKLGVRSRAQAVAAAFRDDLVA
jgi:DNA-binding NarL/FixJ family response regulator